jgi:hypothetical protein
MHTFSQIAHKTTSESNEVYTFPTNSKDTNFEFYRKAYKYEYVPNLAIPIEHDMTNRLMKIFLFMFALGHIDYSIQTKFSYFKKTIDNIFMTANQRDEFINRFCKIQRHYWALSKAVYKYKWKRAPYRIQNDLILTPICESQHNVITILQNNNKYLFTVLDIRNIIEGALTNSPFMFSSPLPPKNPYNNLPFDKATLYNIYFFMKRGNFVLSNLFHNYFLCNFNLTEFKQENEVIIRKKHLEQHVKNADLNELFLEGLYMLSLNKFTRRLSIDRHFPIPKFVEIMRPYLRLHYSQLYSLDSAERDNSECELNILLRKFAEHNPKFGRKCVRLMKEMPNEVYFIDDHIKFQRIKCGGNYIDSHIIFVERSGGHNFVRTTRQRTERQSSIRVLVNNSSPSEEDHEMDDENENDDENDGESSESDD